MLGLLAARRGVGEGSERGKLEQLARYVSRPPLASERLAPTENGQLRLTLKTPFRDGTTHVIFEPEDFIARLAALVLAACTSGGTRDPAPANMRDACAPGETLVSEVPHTGRVKHGSCSKGSKKCACQGSGESDPIRQSSRILQ